MVCNVIVTTDSVCGLVVVALLQMNLAHWTEYPVVDTQNKVLEKQTNRFEEDEEQENTHRVTAEGALSTSHFKVLTINHGLH